MNCKPKTKNEAVEDLFSHLPEPSRSIASRAWMHRAKCLDIEKKYGKEEARKYHELHRFDGTYQTEENKKESIS